MQRRLQPWAAIVVFPFVWGCTIDVRVNHDAGEDAAPSEPDAAADAGDHEHPDATGDAGSEGGGADAAQDATTDGSSDDAGATGEKVSRPGEYEGYGEAIYDGYEVSSQYVAVRDGTKLAVDLYRPKDATSGEVTSDPLPVIWMHTPYNRREFRAAPMLDPVPTGEGYPGAAARLVKYGYVVATVDFRGLYASYGQNIAYNRGEWVEAARNDAYDITEWFAEQPWSTGEIGMWGCSATGGSQLQAATTAPPHLKAIFPMSCEFDVYPFAVPGGMAPPMGVPTRQAATVVPQEQRNLIAAPVDDDEDQSQLMEAFASQAGSLDNPGFAPFRDSLAENIPGVQPWWQISSPHNHLHSIGPSGIAMYLAANWDEGATKHGAFFTFNNVSNPAKLIVGPASHCAWFTVQRETGFDIAVEERRFFDHWLKGIDNGVMTEPKVYYYTYGAPEGSEWATSEVWPLEEEQRTPYYLLADGGLGTAAPPADSAKDETTVDYEVTPETRLEKGLTYTTEPLTEAVQVTGHPSIDLWVDSTATDGDFLVALEDVAPDGTAVSYNVHGSLRASHRSTVDAPYETLGLPYHPSRESDVEPLVPGEPTLLSIELLPTSQVFEAGHQIRLVVTFAGDATPKLEPAPGVSIYHDADHPSAITLPLIPR